MNFPNAARCLMVLLASTPLMLAAQVRSDEAPPPPVEGPAVIGIDEKAPQVFTMVEEMPEFPGGQQALMKYMSSHLQYPEIAKEDGIQGKVFLSFVVQEDGSLRDVRVIRGVHPSLDREAMRVAKSMPLWKPGKNMGKVCCVQYNLPVNFVLQ
ncbi:MAG: energy transducer TonB [Flavobacteriales bacterium]|nr:energy transducer TonB [Flavobacteriales bacterium]